MHKKLEVDERDLPSAKMGRKNAAEMMQASLAGAICECLQGRHTQPVNTTNVDDPARITVGSSFLEERSKKLGNLENALEV